MAMFLKQNEQRSELQERIAAEMQEKRKLEEPVGDTPDGIDDSAYIEGLKETTSLAWVWVLIVLAAIGIVVWLIVIS